MDTEQASGSERDRTELTEPVIGAAMRVHTGLGCGFLERVYENAMLHELRKLRLRAEQQAPATVWWDGVEVGTYALDLLVEDKLVVELKVADAISPAHIAQTIHYLRATDRRLALILNFGTPRLQIKRLLSDPR